MRSALYHAALTAQVLVQTCPACAHPFLHSDGTSRRVGHPLLFSSCPKAEPRPQGVAPALINMSADLCRYAIGYGKATHCVSKRTVGR